MNRPNPWEIEGVDLPIPFTDPRIPMSSVTVEPASLQASYPTIASGELMAFFSCRGGVGSTTLTVNLANLLARAGKSVCVVDLDLQLGDVLVTLGLEPRASLASVVRDMELHEGEGLHSRLTPHPAGFYVLSQVGAVHELTADFVERLPTFLGWLRRRFDVVLVDGLRDFSDPVLAALDNATRLALVLTQDVCSVRRGTRVMALCRELRCATGQLSVLVNRAERRSVVTDADMADAIGVPVLAHVRNDFRAATRGQTWAQLVTDAPGGLTNDLRAVARALWPRAFPRSRHRKWLGLRTGGG